MNTYDPNSKPNEGAEPPHGGNDASGDTAKRARRKGFSQTLFRELGAIASATWHHIRAITGYIKDIVSSQHADRRLLLQKEKVGRHLYEQGEGAAELRSQVVRLSDDILNCKGIISRKRAERQLRALYIELTDSGLAVSGMLDNPDVTRLHDLSHDAACLDRRCSQSWIEIEQLGKKSHLRAAIGAVVAIAFLAMVGNVLGPTQSGLASPAFSLLFPGKLYKKHHPVDDLLANPLDPRRMAAGVPMPDIVPDIAVAEAEAAVRKYPATPRFHYYLGRAYEAAGQPDAAIIAYRKAADLKYPMAFFNLGVAYGAGTLVERDEEKARDHFESALRMGVERARQSMSYFVFDPRGFTNPELYEAIYEGTLHEVEFDQAAFVTDMFLFLAPFFQTQNCPAPISRRLYSKLALGMRSQVFGEIIGDIVQARRTNPSRNLDHAAAAGIQEGVNMQLNLLDKDARAKHDSSLFYERYECDSPVARQFFANLEIYLQRMESPSFLQELEKHGYD